MGIKGSPAHYGTIAIAFHWGAAVAVLGMLATGFAANLSDETEKLVLLRIHVPLGMLVLVVTVARIIWSLVDVRPNPPAGLPRWQVLVGQGVHALLYLLILIMVASGIGLMVMSGAAAVLFLGAGTALPSFSAFAPMAVHAIVALTLLLLVGLHVGAALYHHLILRDGLLARVGVGSRR